MGVTIVEKPVYKAGKLKQIDLYLDYYLKGQKRVRSKTALFLRAGNSKSANEHNTKIRGEILTLKQAESKKLNDQKSVTLVTQKQVSSNVLEYIEQIRNELNKPSLYDNLAVSLKSFLKQSGLKDITFEHINFDFIKRYKAYLLSDTNKKPLTNNSARAYINKLNQTINKAIIDNKTEVNRISGLIGYLKFKDDRKLPEYLEAFEIELIRNHKCKTELQETLKQAFLFSCYTGLRCNDVQSLKWSEINNDSLYRRDKKTSKENYMPLIDKAMDILRERNNVNDISGYVFNGLKTKTMTGNLKKLLKPLKLNKNISFHTARRSFARNLLTNDVSINDVQNLLNHSDIQTTMLYTGIVSKRNKEAMQKLSL